MRPYSTLPLVLAAVLLSGCAGAEDPDARGAADSTNAGGMVTGTTGAPGPGTVGTPGTPAATNPDTIVPDSGVVDSTGGL